MKQTVAVSMIILAVATVIGCSGGSDDTAITDLPQDVSSDVPQEDTGFDYSTVSTVEFSITLKNADGGAVTQAVVSLYSEDPNEVDPINTAITDGNGVASFTATVAKAADSVVLTIEHPGFNEKTVTIDEVHSIAHVIREIHLEAKSNPVTVMDADNDGVEDTLDQFPEDPKYAGSVTGEYVLAFEDLYPKPGDSDFEDLVVHLTLKEFINGKNEVAAVTVTSRTLASGAGYKNCFGIYINGSKYDLILDPHADLKGSWNSRTTDTFVVAAPHELMIDFPEPLSRDKMPAMPYDPFIIPNSDATKGEVHLPSVVTTYQGKVRYSREDALLANDPSREGFVWAIIVPKNWQWPKSAVSIYNAYPQFGEWCTSGGEKNKDWYLYPDSAYIYDGGSAFTGYLSRYGSSPSVMIMVGLGILVLIVLGFNLLRWRRAGAR